MTTITLPDVTVEVAFPAGAVTDTVTGYLRLNDPVLGLLNTGQLADAIGVWIDITPYVLSPNNVTRGSSRVDGPLITYDAGTISLTLDNTDRRFDPSNTSGPYASGGVSQVTPMRAVRIRATYGGVTYNLFKGFADKWDVAWEGPGNSVCTLTATDAFKVFAGIDRAAVASVGAGETTGARITRILNSAAWASTDRVISTGDSIVQATDLSGSPLTEMQTVADAEIGELYVNGNGSLVFRNRQALLEDARSAVSQATFGDGPAELPYEDLALNTDDTTFYNKVRATMAGGSNVQTAADTTSIGQFYEKTFTPSSDPILTTDTDTLNYAQWLLRVAGALELRFDAMMFKPWMDPGNLYPHALGREIGDRITIIRRPPGGGTIQLDMFIRGIAHDFDGVSWTTTWTLQAAAKYGGFFILDSPTLGVLGTDALAY